MLSYPEPDRDVVSYLVCKEKEVYEVRIQYYSFFAALFQSAAETLGSLDFPRSDNTQSALATLWQQYLHTAGNRQTFYRKVVTEAKVSYRCHTATAIVLIRA